MSSEAQKLLKQIDPARVPAHVAIIMDGNGRWAKRRNMPRLWGHRAGAQSVREIVEAAGEAGVKVLTLYAFSTENWSRPKTEIAGLMALLKQTLRREQPNLDRNNVRLETIGDLSALPEDVQAQIQDTKNALHDNTGLCLVLALNYGSRQEIVSAVNALIEDGVEKADEKAIADRLYTRRHPDPDLLIRTSGEFRISNFLLWQIAYAEIHITPVMWPEFRKKHFFQALVDYQNRERRYGAVV